MKANILDLEGNKKGDIDLPEHFEEEIRLDLIKRAFLAIMSHDRVPYGPNIYAGKKYSVRISKRRRDYKTSYGKGISRAPRKVLMRRGNWFYWVGAFAPGTVGGRRAHPPLVNKIFYENINKKERLKAIRSAIAATIKTDLVGKRHKIEGVNLPIVVDASVENLKNTKEFIKLLQSLGLEKELERCKKRKIRAGKGKMRNRKYMEKKGPLFVFSNGVLNTRACENIPGVEAVKVKDLNAKVLAPGGVPGRLVIWSSKAIQELKNLFGVNHE
jgi:large subunit ribosomal protein L4e